MAVKNIAPTRHRATTHLVTIRKTDRPGVDAYCRVANHRASGAGRGLLAPVSPTQIAMVRRPEEGQALSLYSEQVGFWQSRYAADRATQIGSDVVVQLMSEHLNLDPITLLGDPITTIGKKNKPVVLVQGSWLIEGLILPEDIFETAKAGFITRFSYRAAEHLAYHFHAWLPDFNEGQTLLTIAGELGITAFPLVEHSTGGVSVSPSHRINVSSGVIEKLPRRPIAPKGCGLILIGK